MNNRYSVRVWKRNDWLTYDWFELAEYDDGSGWVGLEGLPELRYSIARDMAEGYDMSIVAADGRLWHWTSCDVITVEQNAALLRDERGDW